MKKVDVSVIIVNYKVEKELHECIKSIFSFKSKSTIEIIVVDNDEEKSIESNLKRKYPDVVYIPNPKNSGWGGGVNVGAVKAKGKFLYFLNPDTILLSNAIDFSVDFFEKHLNAGIVSSHLYDKNKHPYDLQGTRELTPARAVVVYSLLNKYFPNNFIAKSFFYKNIDRSHYFEVEIAPLTASMVSAELFREVGMLDPKYFLYFEEYDLGRSIRAKSYKNYILPQAKVLHYWESSTKQINNRNVILEKSRKYYFEKHFGKMRSRIVEAILRRNLKMLVIE